MLINLYVSVLNKVEAAARKRHELRDKFIALQTSTKIDDKKTLSILLTSTAPEGNCQKNGSSVKQEKPIKSNEVLAGLIDFLNKFVR